MRLFSHAKVNLFLKITGRRPDGFHNLETLFASISVKESLELKEIPQGIEILCNDPSVPTDSRNLIWKAAEALADAAGIKKGIRIRLEKQVPPGSGLGAGSSNAAAALIGLNQLWDAGLSKEELRNIAAGIGSDVPFFLEGGLCVATGRGEILSPVSGVPDLWMVLVRPDVSVSTPWAYKTFDSLTSIPKKGSLSDLTNVLDQSPEIIAAHLVNDLEEAVLPAYAEIRQARDDLLQAGAFGALMSGSGSSVFGIVRDQAHAEQIAVSLKNRYPWVHTARISQGAVEIE